MLFGKRRISFNSFELTNLNPMPTLFRKIRRQLLSDNKLTRYIIYALGEIILVVVGILIALRINSWNEEQKNIAKEQVILKELQQDFKDDLVQLDEKITMRSNLLRSAVEILDMIKTEEAVGRDFLIQRFQDIVKDPTFDPIENDLISSGNIRLVRNDSLRRFLARWGSDYQQLQQIELEWQKLRNSIFLPFLIKAKIGRNMHQKTWASGGTPIEILDQDLDAKLYFERSNFKDRLDSPELVQELEDVIATAISPNQVANLQSTSVRRRILAILNLLEQEIEE